MAALNPFKKAVDPDKLTEAERRIFQKYGMPGKKTLLRGQDERKYFDSGDYAMAKAGKAEDGGQSLGTHHPSPEMIPHLTTTTPTGVGSATTTGATTGAGGAAGIVSPIGLQPQNSQGSVGSPVKEASSILQRGVSVDEQDGVGEEDSDAKDGSQGQTTETQTEKETGLQQQGTPVEAEDK